MPRVLRDVLNWAPSDHILIVNDGSRDRTQEIILQAGLAHFRHPRNLGKGACILAAVRHGRAKGFQWLITMDGDGQHDAAHLPHLLDAIAGKECDFVLGYRQGRGASMPRMRQLSNSISSLIISLLAGAGRLHDTQCGFRAFKIDHLDPDILKERGFQLESEMILRLGRMGARFAEVPITTRYGEEKSKIRTFHDSLRFIALIARVLTW